VEIMLYSLFKGVRAGVGLVIGRYRGGADTASPAG
jgi:hypothetical protein